MKSLKYISNFGKALAISIPLLISSSSCKKSTTLEGTVEINREFIDMLTMEKKGSLVVDPLEDYKSSFLIDYDVKNLDKNYNMKLKGLSKGDTVKVSKKYYPWKKHDPDYKVLFNK